MNDLEIFEMALIEADRRFLEDHTHTASQAQDPEVDGLVEDWFKQKGKFFELR